MAVRLEHIYSQGHGHGHGQDGQNSQQKKKDFRPCIADASAGLIASEVKADPNYKLQISNSGMHFLCSIDLFKLKRPVRPQVGAF